MSLATKISNFKRDAKVKIGELTYEIHKTHNQKKRLDKHTLRLELATFLTLLDYPYDNISDSDYFLDWTDIKIEKEIDYLYARASMSEFPEITYVGNKPVVLSEEGIFFEGNVIGDHDHYSNEILHIDTTSQLGVSNVKAAIDALAADRLKPYKAKVIESTLKTITDVVSVSLIDAPGVNQAIKVEFVMPLGNASNGYNRNVFLRYAGEDENICQIPIQNSVSKWIPISPSGQYVEANKAIVLAADGTVTTGTNDLFIIIYYRIINLSGYVEK